MLTWINISSQKIEQEIAFFPSVTGTILRHDRSVFDTATVISYTDIGILYASIGEHTFRSKSRCKRYEIETFSRRRLRNPDYIGHFFKIESQNEWACLIGFIRSAHVGRSYYYSS